MRCFRLLLSFMLLAICVMATSSFDVQASEAGEMMQLDGLSPENKSTPTKSHNDLLSLDNNAELETLAQPKVVFDDVEKDFSHTEHWFKLERKHLIAMLIGVGCSLVVGLGLGWLLHWLLRIKEGSHPGFKRRLIQGLSGPIIMLLTLISVFIFMVPVVKTLPGAFPYDIRIFLALVSLIVAWGTFHVVEAFACKMRVIAQRDTNNLSTLMVEIVRKITKIFIIVLVILFVGQSIFNINISTLLAGAGVIGLAVALASKDVMANFFGTVIIVSDQPFQVGDRIRINDCTGKVLSVGMRSTRILTEDENIFTIPNSLFTDQEVCNFSKDGLCKLVFDVGMVYNTTDEQMQQAMDLLGKIVADFHGPDLDQYKPRIFFNTFADSSMNIRVIMWLKTGDYKVEEEWINELNMIILREFNRANLNMAYPTTTNYLMNTPGNPLMVQMASQRSNNGSNGEHSS